MGENTWAWRVSWSGSGAPWSAFPLQALPFDSVHLFPFFEGLLPEGWYKEIVCRTIKIDEDDSFGLLIRACKDCVGAVSIEQDPS